jgi:segregation and condensation protein B
VLRNAELIAAGPRSPQPGAPYTYVTTPTFLTVFGFASLRNLPDLDRLEEAGLLGTVPLPEQLRDVLGMRDAEGEDEEAENGADPTYVESFEE